MVSKCLRGIRMGKDFRLPAKVAEQRQKLPSQSVLKNQLL
jgi:hypothetical protein